MRDVVREYALETLADPDAVLVIDETGFLKQGKSSCGVGRQYTGSAGKITNCQTWTSLAAPVPAEHQVVKNASLPSARLRRISRPRVQVPLSALLNSAASRSASSR
jgi:SRSO17 transposase